MRQVGKTTLARELAAGASEASEAPSATPVDANWFDLEDPAAEAQLAQPMLALAGLAGLVVIDEVQRAPDLFKVLRVLVDFTLGEAGVDAIERLWWRGGLPRSFTAAGDMASAIWRQSFIRTVVERDLPQLGMNVPAPAIHRSTC